MLWSGHNSRTGADERHLAPHRVARGDSCGQDHVLEAGEVGGLTELP